MPLLESRLLVVTDRHQTKGRPLLSVLGQALKAGSPAFQLRERDLCTKDLVALAEELQQIALPRGSQLRSNSLPVAVARRLLGPHRLLGVSVHSVSEAVQAESAGADYIVLGPIYETPSKEIYGPPLGLATLEEAARAVGKPIIGIGGVTASRARDMRLAGAFGVAVITAVLGADDVEAATRVLLDAVTSTSSSTSNR
jgi:thiamine-phosphate pyrophosphorylase